MDWITGIQNAINYIEDHITEELDYEVIARESASSSFHFQRVFGILCGFTLGEYIRRRRLSLAGAELAAGKGKVIDVALRYGYDTPESFARAFQKFHGNTPSQARIRDVKLKSFSCLSVLVSLEGGSTMNYKIVEKSELLLYGYKRHFTGTPMERNLQDHHFACETRLRQAVLQYMAHDADTTYNVISGFDDEGYDFFISSYLGREDRVCFADTMGEEIAGWFEQIIIPAGTYMVCETERCKYPANDADGLYRNAVTQWLPSLGYELAEGPEVEVLHWFYKEGDEALNSSRYLELWLPIQIK